MLQPNIEVNQNPELAQLVQQAANGSGAIGLSLNGDQQAVILSLEAFKSVIASFNPFPLTDPRRVSVSISHRFVRSWVQHS